MEINLNKDNCFSIFLPGEPVAQQSFRFKRDGHKYPTEAAKRKEVIRKMIKYQLPPGFKPFQGPLFCFVYFVFTPPKRLNRYQKEIIGGGKVLEKSTKPDEDNLKKNLYDAMQGLVYVNDSQVCGSVFAKLYREKPGIQVLVYKLRNEPYRRPMDPVARELFRLPDEMFYLWVTMIKEKEK